MQESPFKERIEFTDGKLVGSRGKTMVVEVGALGPRINELRLILDGHYVGMDLEEAMALRDTINKGINVLKQNHLQVPELKGDDHGKEAIGE